MISRPQLASAFRSPGLAIKFGIRKEYFPRFSIVEGDADVQVLGRWEDSGEVAFAAKSTRGFHSVYVGTGPIPVEILRWLAVKTGARLWSSKPDVVRASEDAAMIIATGDGERILRLHKALAPADGEQAARKEHILNLKFGDIPAFVRPTS